MIACTNCRTDARYVSPGRASTIEPTDLCSTCLAAEMQAALDYLHGEIRDLTAQANSGRDVLPAQLLTDVERLTKACEAPEVITPDAFVARLGTAPHINGDWWWAS